MNAARMVVMGLVFSVSSTWAATRGSYMVPTPTELASVASFEVGCTVDKTADGKLSIVYELPEELVGTAPYTVRLKESEKANWEWSQMQGENGDSARCSLGDSTVTCFVLYPVLSIDPNNVASVLQKKFEGAPNLLSRERVAKLFSNDPKGIVSCNLK